MKFRQTSYCYKQKEEDKSHQHTFQAIFSLKEKPIANNEFISYADIFAAYLSERNGHTEDLQDIAFEILFFPKEEKVRKNVFLNFLKNQFPSMEVDKVLKYINRKMEHLQFTPLNFDQ